MMSNNWMTCTSCHSVVQFNATGTCLGCQWGFAGQQDEDKYNKMYDELEAKKRRKKDKKV